MLSLLANEGDAFMHTLKCIVDFTYRPGFLYVYQFMLERFLSIQLSFNVLDIFTLHAGFSCHFPCKCWLFQNFLFLIKLHIFRTLTLQAAFFFFFFKIVHV